MGVRCTLTLLNYFDAKTSAHCSRVFIVTELLVSGTQCSETKTVEIIQKLGEINSSKKTMYIYEFPSWLSWGKGALLNVSDIPKKSISRLVVKYNYLKHYCFSLEDILSM